MFGLFLHFLAAYTQVVFFIKSWETFSKTSRKFFSLKIQLYSIILSILTVSIFVLFGNNQIIKIVLMIFIMVIANYYLYSYDIKKSIIASLITQTIIMISEMLSVIILHFLTKENINDFISTDYGHFIANIVISIIAFVILFTKVPQQIYDIVIKFIEKIKRSDIIIYAFTVFAIAITSTAASYLHWDAIYVLIINTSLLIFFLFISVNLAKTKNEFDDVNNKYETSITSLREYEAMIDKYRIYNHENKNELQTLRNLISKKNTKALKYIDSILDNKIKDNEKIMHKTSKIPEGGLRATIYAKLCTMDELGIKYSLDIAKDIRTVDLINMKEDIVLNICKILGVFLDNAIEAVKDLKTKHIGIEIYLMDGDLCVDITNNYEGKLDMNKIGSSKYTTKGGNHGYGLSLVNQIISDYPDRFENEKSITKNTFTQKIKIKM